MISLVKNFLLFCNIVGFINIFQDIFIEATSVDNCFIKL